MQVRGTRVADKPSETLRLLALMGFTAHVHVDAVASAPTTTAAAAAPAAPASTARGGSQAYDAPQPPASPPQPSRAAGPHDGGAAFEAARAEFAGLL